MNYQEYKQKREQLLKELREDLVYSILLLRKKGYTWQRIADTFGMKTRMHPEQTVRRYRKTLEE